MTAELLPHPHPWRAGLLHALDDIQALLTGAALAAFGMLLFQAAHLVPGGAVGLALLLHYTTGLHLPWAFMLATAPFYLLAALRMGRAFTLKTVLAVVLATLFSALLPHGLALGAVSGWIAAPFGGLLCGVGILILFRHRASLGGLNVLVLHLQQHFGWSPGLVQAALDALIVVGGSLLVGHLAQLAWSLLAVATLNLVLAVNHRRA